MLTKTNKSITVFHLARLEKNPYLNLLFKALRTKTIYIKGGEYQSKNIFFIARVLATGKPHIFHIHDIHYFLQGKENLNFYNNILRRNIKFTIFIIQLIILKLIGVKIIWTVHEWSDKYNNGNQNILPIWNQILSSAIDVIITHCQSTKKTVEKSFKLNHSQKVFQIDHGNYINAYPNTLTSCYCRQHLHIDQDKLVFLLFGNIYPAKGFDTAISSFKALENLQTFLLIVGRPTNQEIDVFINKQVNKTGNIRYIPYQVPDEEVQIYMNASDCVILPYQVFTTSGVAILAMSYAKACIAPNIGYFSEIFDKKGALLFDATTSDGLLKAMQQAINARNNLAAMGKHNYYKVKEWSWERVADMTIDIYSNIAVRW